MFKLSKRNYSSAAGAFALVVCISSGTASANDMSEICQNFAATVDAGYIFGSDHETNGTAIPLNANFHTFFGEGAALSFVRL